MAASVTPRSLYEAVKQNNLQEVKSLLEAHADPNQIITERAVFSSFSKTILAAALPQNRISDYVIQALIQHGAQAVIIRNGPSAAAGGRREVEEPLSEAAQRRLDGVTRSLLISGGSGLPQDLSNMIAQYTSE